MLVKLANYKLTSLVSFTDKKAGISVGVAVAIGCGGLLAVLIVIGSLVYWKKYHHRSRLRAAYYNDISMNDPLYEDFGPEVA